jgi:hypothetical protein
MRSLQATAFPSFAGDRDRLQCEMDLWGLIIEICEEGMWNFSIKISNLIQSWSSLESFAPQNIAQQTSPLIRTAWHESSWNAAVNTVMARSGNYLQFITSMQEKIKTAPLGALVPRIENGMQLSI